MPSPQLLLQASDFKDSGHWNWRLTDLHGTHVGDHAVALESADWQTAASLDLHNHLRHQASPDHRRADEERILQEVGAWLGAKVLGPLAAKLIERAPITVRVVLPPEASGLLYLPLELAHAGDKPLAAQHVSLVFELE